MWWPYLLLLVSPSGFESVGHVCVDHFLLGQPPPNSTSISVGRAVDGDTVALWLSPALPSPLGELHLRVQGVDCPETHQPHCEDERLAGLAATRFTTAWLLRAVVVRLCAWDKYGGRVLGDLGDNDGNWLGQALLATGHAHTYSGRGLRTPWCTPPPFAPEVCA
jgi:endonuclease YncB( thermonuclease family)